MDNENNEMENTDELYEDMKERLQKMSDDFNSISKSLDSIERKIKVSIGMLRKQAVRRMMESYDRNYRAGLMDDNTVTKVFISRSVWAAEMPDGESAVGSYGWAYEEESENGNKLRIQIHVNMSAELNKNIAAATHFIVIDVISPTDDVTSEILWCTSYNETRAYLAHHFGLDSLQQVELE